MGQLLSGRCGGLLLSCPDALCVFCPPDRLVKAGPAQTEYQAEGAQTRPLPFFSQLLLHKEYFYDGTNGNLQGGPGNGTDLHLRPGSAVLIEAASAVPAGGDFTD